MSSATLYEYFGFSHPCHSFHPQMLKRLIFLPCCYDGMFHWISEEPKHDVYLRLAYFWWYSGWWMCELSLSLCSWANRALTVRGYLCWGVGACLDNLMSSHFQRWQRQALATEAFIDPYTSATVVKTPPGADSEEDKATVKSYGKVEQRQYSVCPNCWNNSKTSHLEWFYKYLATHKTAAHSRRGLM